MGLTPYELRLELLKMSKDMLEQKYHTSRDLAMRKWENAANSLSGGQEFLSEIPEYPTEDEIVSKAKLLNEFISEK